MQEQYGINHYCRVNDEIARKHEIASLCPHSHLRAFALHIQHFFVNTTLP